MNHHAKPKTRGGLIAALSAAALLLRRLESACWRFAAYLQRRRDERREDARVRRIIRTYQDAAGKR